MTKSKNKIDFSKINTAAPVQTGGGNTNGGDEFILNIDDLPF